MNKLLVLTIKYPQSLNYIPIVVDEVDMTCISACPRIRKGGRKSERPFFLLFNFLRGGGSSENSRENDISD